ncbi:MAG TPA: hypothetical protein VK174_16525, partial [Chitinophagales bacterium]|nr:hypothetical protein [Chitinophagales bacterium]
TVEEINKLVLGGMPFRDAYKVIGNAVNNGEFKPERKFNHTHEGSINNLCTAEIAEVMRRTYAQLNSPVKH